MILALIAYNSAYVPSHVTSTTSPSSSCAHETDDHHIVTEIVDISHKRSVQPPDPSGTCQVGHSIIHRRLHPSPSSVFPSSHASDHSTTPLPHHVHSGTAGTAVGVTQAAASPYHDQFTKIDSKSKILSASRVLV